MGFKVIEDFLRRAFNGYGLLVGKHPLPFLVTPLVLNAILTVGLVVFFNMDVDCVRLFTPRHSPSLREVRMLQQFSRQGDSSSNAGDRKELAIAGANNESSMSMFEKAKQVKYFWYDIHMTTYDESNILDEDVWREMVELIREIYDNFTCTIREPDRGRRRFGFIPDFCRPEVGCGR
uniref:Uncharacterized protein n=1 Tax=Romanomermis culicivorax TaxID=13658 RepID=A0A915IJM8_ROMCU